MKELEFEEAAEKGLEEKLGHKPSKQLMDMMVELLTRWDWKKYHIEVSKKADTLSKDEQARALPF